MNPSDRTGDWILQGEAGVNHAPETPMHEGRAIPDPEDGLPKITRQKSRSDRMDPHGADDKKDCNESHA
jgi:hypothetical protein